MRAGRVCHWMNLNGNSIYRVELSKNASRYFSKLDRFMQVRIIAAFDKLAVNPQDETLDIKTMVGRIDEKRLRVGKYRIIFTVDDGVLLVYVIDIGPRGDIYKK